MADNVTQFAHEAQGITRSMYGAAQGIAEVQLNIMQRLSGVQQNIIQQAYEAANDQLQVISRVREPREFAAAQAEFVKSHGQRYVDSVKQVVDITTEAWEEYGERLEQGANNVANKTQRAASSRKTA